MIVLFDGTGVRYNDMELELSLENFYAVTLEPVCGADGAFYHPSGCRSGSYGLQSYEISGTRVMPSLARSYESNGDATVWTFHLREGVTFHDGSTLDAGDVVLSYVVQWDAANPLHVGRTGDFTYFSAFFGGFLNGS